MGAERHHLCTLQRSLLGWAVNPERGGGGLDQTDMKLGITTPMRDVKNRDRRGGESLQGSLRAGGLPRRYHPGGNVG